MARIRHAYIAPISIALGALFGVLLLRHPTQTTPKAFISTGNIRIPVTIADTVHERERGLSGTASLQAGTGTLFIFPKAGMYGFWMKDMQYPLDIVWIDDMWKVVGVQTASPDSYPTVFYPPSDVRYVLEINAKEATVDNLLIGTELQFHP